MIEESASCPRCGGPLTPACTSTKTWVFCPCGYHQDLEPPFDWIAHYFFLSPLELTRRDEGFLIFPWPRTAAQRLAIRFVACWASYVLGYKVVALEHDRFVVVSCG